MDIPKTQTGLWIEKPSPDTRIQLRHDLPVPMPGSGEVLVKIECSGLCHSDIANVLGRHHMSADIHTPGHEGIGRVVAPAGHALLGKRVGVRWMASACLNCEICAVNETSCPWQKNHGRNKEGTLKQYTLADERFAVPVPEGLVAEEAAPLLCAGISQFSAIQRSNAKPGEFIVITGAGGGLGHLGIQIARNRGLKVIAIDTGPEKRDFCLSLGATAFVDYRTEDVLPTVHAHTNGHGAHAVICTAGAAAAYDLAVRLVRPQGTVVCVGLPGLDYRLPLGPMDLVQGGITVTGMSNGTRADMRELLAMAERGEVRARVEVRELGLDEGEGEGEEGVRGVVERVERGALVGRAVFRLPV